ncbi:MAG: dipeptidase [Candidatus Rariloculaceae bacterium]
MNHWLRFLFYFAHVFLIAGCLESGPADDDDVLMTHAQAIHSAVITLDSHDDIPYDFATPAVDPLNADRQLTLEKMREGGLDVAFFIVYVAQTERTPENYAKAKTDAMIKFNAIHRMAEEMYPELIEIAYDADDIERIHASGKLVAAIGIENGYVIGQDLSLLQTYYDLGARYITLAHGGHNDISDSAQARPQFGDDESEHEGISTFGTEVIEEMNRLGIMVDISHISKAAALDAIRLSRAPVIASHTNAYALAAHFRNMDDETLLALRNNGGVIQTVALDVFVKTPPPERNVALDELWIEFGLSPGNGPGTLAPEQRVLYDQRWAEILTRWPGATLEDFVDHIDYAVNLIGIEHVGISSDFDGGGGITGWQDAAETFNVTLELVRRGYNETDIEKLWGGNLMRVWREVEAIAAATIN